MASSFEQNRGQQSCGPLGTSSLQGTARSPARHSRHLFQFRCARRPGNSGTTHLGIAAERLASGSPSQSRSTLTQRRCRSQRRRRPCRWFARTSRVGCACPASQPSVAVLAIAFDVFAVVHRRVEGPFGQTSLFNHSTWEPRLKLPVRRLSRCTRPALRSSRHLCTH